MSDHLFEMTSICGLPMHNQSREKSIVKKDGKNMINISYMRINIFLTLLIIGAMFSACTNSTSLSGDSSTQPPENNNESPSLATSEVVSTTSDTPFTITDSTGRNVSFNSVPERIALVGRGVIMLADGVYLFPEASGRLVAIGKTSQWKSDFVPIVDPNYHQKTILEIEAGPEQIAAMQPDLVLMKSSMSEKLGKSVEILGIPVIYLDFETPEQYPRDIAILGDIFQNPLRAGEVIDYFEQRKQNVEQALSDLDEGDNPRILILYYSDKDGQLAFNVPPRNWMQTLMANLAGGNPVWEDIDLGNGWTKVNFEQIAVWDADFVFIVAYTNEALDVVQDLKSDPQWQALRAVKEGKIFAFPSDFYSWDQPDSRWILGLTWLASKLHPDKFPELNMKNEVIHFYKELYSLDDDTIQKVIMPTLEKDIK